VAPVTTRAVVLRGYDYGDSSRILRFYTEDHGVLSVVARGVRGRSAKGSAAVSSFATGELTAYVKENRELHTMKDFACNRARGGLGTDVLRFAGASAAVDLVLAHAEQERHVALFAALEHALDEITAIARPDLAGGILAGLWSIIGAFGFSPELDGCVRCGRPLTPEEVGRFDLGAGGIRCETCSHGAAGPRLGPITRGHVSTLLEGRAPVGLQYPRRHLGLVSDFVAHHVASRPLKSLGFLGGLLPADPEVTVDA
jgi:DNA repair protein RecO (recombination protein O)